MRSDNKVGLKEIQKDTRRNCFGARYTCLLCKKRLYVRGRWKTSGAAAEGRAKFEEEHMRDEHEIYAEGRQ